MKIIDWEKKGNVVRFYLGAEECDNYWGDDWNDAPYDCNAEQVYDEYVTGFCDVSFPFDYNVFEPCETTYRHRYPNCEWTKEDMMNRKVPCIVASPLRDGEYDWEVGFDTYVGDNSGIVQKFYFGDHMEPTKLVTKVEE